MDKPLEKAIKIIKNVVNPDKIILFGSRAKDTYSADSDYDLLVLKRGIKEKRKTAQEIYLNFKNIDAPIDILINDPGKYEEIKNDPYMIYYEIDKYGKVVYEKRK